MVRHHKRLTWEIPGGHIESGEDPDSAAKRELYEETGALTFDLQAIGDYGVTRDQTSYGRLYLANIEDLGELPDSEIIEVKGLEEDMEWTYEKIQPILFEYVKDKTQ